MGPLFCLLCAIKTNDYEQDFLFYQRTKGKAVDKTLNQCFLKELKATCKISDR